MAMKKAKILELKRDLNTPIEDLKELVSDEYIDSIDKYRTIIQASLSKWVQNLQDNKVKLDKVKDLEDLMKIDMLMQRYLKNELKSGR